jgi:hypothetical protein
MANKQRGELTVTLGEREFVMRPTFEAIANIEDKLGMSVPQLISRLSASDMKLTFIATIIWEGILAANGGKPPKLNEDVDTSPRMRYKDVGEMIFSEGLLAVMKQEAVLKFLVHSMAGDRVMSDVEDKKEVDQHPQQRTE